MGVKSEERALRMAMLDRWKRSGKSVRAFCEVEKVSYHMFVYWKRKYSRRSNNQGFIHLKPSNLVDSPSSICEIIFTNGNRINLSIRPEASYLKELLT